jgi:hypothetical protein
MMTLFKRSSLPVFAAAALAFAGTAAAQERVTWTDQMNVAVRGGALEKTRGCDGCGDAGATSRQTIDASGGFVEFTVGEDWTYWIAGLSHRTRGTAFNDIEFAIRFNGNGWADVVESGRYIGGDTEYRAGDTFRIEVGDQRIRYMKDGAVFAVSRQRPTFPLAFDVSLGSIGSTVANARLGAGAAALAGRTGGDELSRLDRNRDGVIQRREWAGTRRMFNQRDLNGDGVLTRRELEDRDDDIDGLVFGRDRDDLDPVGTAGDLIVVSATDRWTDTGLTVRAGDTVNIDADGRVQLSGDRNDMATPDGGNRSAPGALVRNAPAGALIARIGNSAPFAVGTRRTITRAPTSGRLFLSVNDDYLGDNDGQFRVSVTIGNR